jgi:hypothetical protein
LTYLDLLSDSLIRTIIDSDGVDERELHDFDCSNA